MPEPDALNQLRNETPMRHRGKPSELTAIRRSGVVIVTVDQRDVRNENRKGRERHAGAEPSSRASDLPNKEELGTVQAVRQPNTVVKRPKPEGVRQETIAKVMVRGLAINALTAAQFSKGSFGDVDLTECLANLNGVPRSRAAHRVKSCDGKPWKG